MFSAHSGSQTDVVKSPFRPNQESHENTSSPIQFNVVGLRRCRLTQMYFLENGNVTLS